MMNTLITLINEIRNNVNIVEYMFKVSWIIDINIFLVLLYSF